MPRKQSTPKPEPPVIEALVEKREPGDEERKYEARRRRRKGGPQPGSGRKTVLTDTALRIMVMALERGNRLPVAATLAGMSHRSVYRWLEWGADPPPPERANMDNRKYIAFREAVEEARAIAEAKAVESVTTHLPTDPQAAIWFLRQQSPDWNRDRAPVAPDRPADQPVTGVVVNQTVIHVDLETLQKVAAQELARRREEGARDGGDEESRRAALARLVTDQ